MHIPQILSVKSAYRVAKSNLKVITIYRIEGNIGGLQLWRIHYKSMFDEINFGEFEAPVKYNDDSFRDTYSRLHVRLNIA